MQAILGNLPIFIRFSGNGLAFISVLLLLLTLPATVYLLLRGKERATRWLAGFLICISLTLITMFLVNSIVIFGWALNPLQDAFICLGGVALVRFAYSFPASPRPRAATVMTLFSAAIAAAALAYALAYAARGFAMGTDFSSAYPPIAPAFYLLTPLAIAAVMGVFAGRAVQLARAGAPNPSRFAGVRGALRALASPPNAASRAQRNFALAVSLGIVQAAASYAAAFLNSALASIGIALGALLALAAILLVYLNHAPEPHSLVVRLVGITLVCLLGVMTVVGHTAIAVQARQLEVSTFYILRWIAAGDPALLRDDPDPNMLLLLSWDAEAVRAGRAGEATVNYIHPTITAAGLPERLAPPPLTSGAPSEPWSTMHPLILSGQPPRLVQVYYLEAQGRLFVVVTAGQIYARAIHTLNVSLMLTSLLGAAALIVLVPRFVRSGLIAPLQQLVAGIRRADQGDLRTPVPVQYDDEIGFVTRSFNRTMASVRATQQALVEANERQEAVVSQRTAQLAAALDAAERSEREARTANEAKSTFLANVSHELRTPLTVIVGNSDLLNLDEGLTPDQRSAAEAIQRAAGHLLEIVNDLLELRRAEAGKLEKLNTPFRPALLAAQLEEMFRQPAAAKGLALSVAAECADDEAVITDQRKVRQIAVNLINNAVKYTDQGEVRARVSCTDGPNAEGEGARGKARRRLVLVVEDTGPGIAPEKAEAIWQPFQRLHPESPSAGAGLGLVISREFARFLGGELTMQSTGVPGEGTVFHLEIPVERASAGLMAAPILLGEGPGTVAAQEARVMVVDDDAENRELLRRILSSFGIQVQCAANGGEAVQICMAWHPHLVFMDIRMPVMDGQSATQQIRRLCATAYPAGGGPKIVALTAHAPEEQRRQLLQGGFHDLLRKPYRRRDIAAALERHLQLALPLPAAAGVPLPAAPQPNPEDNIQRLLHDVGNAVTTIGLSVEMLLDAPAGSNEANREFLERIERSARTIERLLADARAGQAAT